MAIYIQTGKSNSQDSIINGKYAFFDRSNNIKRSNNWIFNGEYIIIPGEGMVFEPKYYYGKFDLHQRCYAIKPNNENLLCKYLYYFCFINKKNFYLFSTGTTVPSLRLSSFSWMKKKKWIPIKQQQKIIDIIEPKKHLFEKYSNCIRIDSFENTQKDLQKIIDIIEPLNKIQNKTKKIRQLLKKYLLNQYILNNNPYINLDKIIKIHNLKRQNQLDYLPTAAVSELTYDSVNKIDLELEDKSLSRANLTVVPNSIIISKLLGENKVLPITKTEIKYVFSTGFFNFTSENNNHLLMYFLSNHFIKQKKIFATGTTMLAITKDTLKCFQIKKPSSKIIKVNLIKVFSLLNSIEIYLDKTKQLLFKLLVQ